MLLSIKQIQIFKELSQVADNLPSTLKSLYLRLYEKVVHTSNMIWPVLHSNSWKL